MIKTIQLLLLASLCISCAFGESANEGRKSQIVPVKVTGITPEQSRKFLQTFIAHEPAVGLFAKTFPAASAEALPLKDGVGILINVRVDERYLVTLYYDVLFSSDSENVERSRLIEFAALDLSLLPKEDGPVPTTPIKISEMARLCENPSEFLKKLLSRPSQPVR